MFAQIKTSPLLTILSNMPPSALIQAIPLLLLSLCSKFQFSYQTSLFALISLHRMSQGSIAPCHTDVPGLVLGLLESWWGGKKRVLGVTAALLGSDPAFRALLSPSSLVHSAPVPWLHLHSECLGLVITEKLSPSFQLI